MTDSRSLYRSSSTSQLNTSSYIKGDDPTDGINLGNGSTMVNASTENVHSASMIGINMMRKTKPIVPIKAASYDDIARVTFIGSPHTPSSIAGNNGCGGGISSTQPKRANFPYAFLEMR